MLRIKDVMTKDVVTTTRSSTVNKLIKLFLKHHIHLIPVVDREKKLVGVASLTTLIRIFMPRYFDLIDDFSFISDFGILDEVFLAQASSDTEKLFLVDDVMITRVISASPEDSLLKVSAIMHSNKIERIPVIDKNNRLIGIISQSDIVLAIFKEKGQ